MGSQDISEYSFRKTLANFVVLSFGGRFCEGVDSDMGVIIVRA